jgi:hypothetical protein
VAGKNGRYAYYLKGQYIEGFNQKVKAVIKTQLEDLDTRINDLQISGQEATLKTYLAISKGLNQSYIRKIYIVYYISKSFIFTKRIH